MARGPARARSMRPMTYVPAPQPPPRPAAISAQAWESAEDGSRSAGERARRRAIARSDVRTPLAAAFAAIAARRLPAAASARAPAIDHARKHERRVPARVAGRPARREVRGSSRRDRQCASAASPTRAPFPGTGDDIAAAGVQADRNARPLGEEPARGLEVMTIVPQTQTLTGLRAVSDRLGDSCDPPGN